MSNGFHIEQVVESAGYNAYAIYHNNKPAYHFDFSIIFNKVKKRIEKKLRPDSLYDRLFDNFRKGWIKLCGHEVILSNTHPSYHYASCYIDFDPMLISLVIQELKRELNSGENYENMS